MDAIDQILGSDCLLVLWDGDGTGNRKGMLNQRGADSDYSLNRYVASFLSIRLLSIARHCWEVRVEIRVTETPASRRQVKPRISGRIRNNVAYKFKRPIEQVNICNMSGS